MDNKTFFTYLAYECIVTLLVALALPHADLLVEQFIVAVAICTVLYASIIIMIEVTYNFDTNDKSTN